MDLDDILDVEDYAAATITHLAERIARSAGEAQLVYREIELDELWRLLDIAIKDTEPKNAAALVALKATVTEAHDLVGIDSAPLEAAQRLQDGLKTWKQSGAA